MNSRHIAPIAFCRSIGYIWRAMSAESMNDFIIQCSRSELKSWQITRIDKILRSGINWRSVLDRAAYEGVLPLFSRNLKSFRDRIPETLSRQMKNAYLANLARNSRLFHKLVPLLRAFDRGGLRAVLTRGGRLAETVYHDWGLRYFVDIDFMVHPGETKLLVEVLEQQGYWENSHASRFPGEDVRELAWIMETGFHKDDLILDFHFNFPGIEIPLDADVGIWDHIQSLDFFGIPAKIFAPEYELCLLCLHGQKHCYERLIWLTDIAELAALPEIDWQKFVDICRALEISAQVYYGFYLVNMLWSDTISMDVIKNLEPGRIRKKILSVIWPSNKVLARQINTEQIGHASFIFLFGSVKRLGLKFKTLLSIAFPPRGYMSFFYKVPKNSIKIYLHYFWRIFRPLPLLFRALLRI